MHNDNVQSTPLPIAQCIPSMHVRTLMAAQPLIKGQC